jgi:hypothetical protein
MTEIIHFPALLIKIQTMVDGAIRLTMDMPETQIETAKLLMECKARGGLLEIAAVAIDQVISPVKQTGTDVQICEGRSTNKSEWQTKERPGADIPA